ncbi:MAG: hypothetical protein ABSG88_07010 [Bradyrhizobium sp.]
MPARTKLAEACFRAGVGQDACDVAGSGQSLDGGGDDFDGSPDEFDKDFAKPGCQRIGIADKGQGQILNKDHLHVQLLWVKLNIVQKWITVK